MQALEKAILKKIAMTDQEYELVIFTILSLIKMTAYENIMNSLNVIIVHSINRIRPLALRIIHSIKNWFI